MSKRSFAILALIGIATTLTFGRDAAEKEATAIIAVERAALDRWGRGDPGGYLELYAGDVSYFDPMREQRVDGVEAMRRLLEPIKGLIRVDHYEMIAPNVRRIGDVAILTYNLVSHGRRADAGAVITRWNATAVYAQIRRRWKILHSHWSYTQPELKVQNGL